jgi:hypothetical protein
MKPQRIQLKRIKGWRMPDNTVKVDRSTQWGNPFKVHGAGTGSRMTAEDSVFFFRQKLEEEGLVLSKLTCITPEDIRRELRGKNLACWCPLDQPCHADVLLELANDQQRDEAG